MSVEELCSCRVERPWAAVPTRSTGSLYTQSAEKSPCWTPERYLAPTWCSCFLKLAAYVFVRLPAQIKTSL